MGLKRLPRHIGVIPDGNRRWAVAHGMDKKDGYRYGIEPGFRLYDLCCEAGIEELTLYGFTVDNTKRPAEQKRAFQQACVEAVEELARRDAALLVVGNTRSSCFPKELLPYTERKTFGSGKIKVNFLVNYGWDWDLNGIYENAQKEPFRNQNRISQPLVAEHGNEQSQWILNRKRKGLGKGLGALFDSCGYEIEAGSELSQIRSGVAAMERKGTVRKNILQEIHSKDISNIDLLIRWGGRNRLSGFLPVQSVYADTFIFDELWPDFTKEQFFTALQWYQSQDVTLGG